MAPAVPAPRERLVPHLVEGDVLEHLPGALVRRPLIEASREAMLLRVPPVASYLVRPEEPVRVQRAPGATDADVRCFLEGPVAAAAALLRGLVPLRAATVDVGGRAVAIVGASAVGKSSLAAALALRGHRVLADAVTVAEPGEPGGAQLVRPLAPHPVLWPDMARELGLDPEGGRLVRPTLEKRAFRLGPQAEPRPLAAVVLLSPDGRLTSPQTERTAGWGKTALLVRACWHRPLVASLGLHATHFRELAALSAPAACARLDRPPRGASPGRLAEIVEGILE